MGSRDKGKKEVKKPKKDKVTKINVPSSGPAPVEVVRRPRKPAEEEGDNA
jgi:hypothetical protein